MFGVAVKARVGVVSDTPTGALPPGVTSTSQSILDPSNPTFWVIAWGLALVGLIWLVFMGLVF